MEYKVLKKEYLEDLQLRINRLQETVDILLEQWTALGNKQWKLAHNDPLLEEKIVKIKGWYESANKELYALKHGIRIE